MFNFLKRNSRSDDMKIAKDFFAIHFNQILENKERISQDVFDVTMFFIEEAIILYDSMDLLMQENHFQGCLPIAKSLLENSINIQYIYNDDIEVRAKNFKLASASNFLKRFSKVDDNSIEHKEVKKQFENILKDYSPENKTIKQKSDEINIGSVYQDVYKRLSEYVHPSYKLNRDFDQIRPYIIYLKRVVFSDILLINAEALRRICEKYDLDGAVIKIDDPGYKGIVFHSTNPKKQEEREKNNK